MLRREAGFTMLELMIIMVMAMTILGGLLLNFTSQSKQYKFQNKKVDTVQDLEFGLRFMANDLQGAVIGVGSDTLILPGNPLVGTDPYTVIMDGYTAATPSTTATMLSFYVWDEEESTDPYTMRAFRCYQFRPPGSGVGTASTHGQLYYTRNAASCAVDGGVIGYGQVLGEKANGLKGMQMTHFRVFQDNDATTRAGYTGIPKALPSKLVRDENNKTYQMPGFTILIEIEVDAAPPGSPVDVLGNTITNGKRRLWRYVQTYPNTVVIQ